jgi:hypothetical protein
MRIARLLVVCVVCLAAFTVPYAATAADNDFSVAVPVIGGTGSGQSLHCDGLAPRDPGCVRQMTLTSNFTIKFSLSVVPLYRGYFIIRGFTETGATTIICDWVTMPAQPCPYFYEGVYFEGQTWTMVVAAAGMGYWSVDVS